ncbi:MAG: glycosyltransferase family 2 protein [Methanobacteriaceae archaeon]|nr:glycosyltransferase family 2 protein [Methanobacteriaceae archaeon]
MKILKKYISIIIVTYNSREHIEACINSINKQKYPENYIVEIVIVENLSTDGTYDFIREKFPSLKIVKNSENNGYGNGNNLGAKNANGEYLVIINPDTIVEEGWLEKLIEPLTENKKLITTPKVLIYDGSKINACGLIIHFTGLGFTRGFRSEKKLFSEIEYVNGIFGCCFAIKKEDFKYLGGFDENIFMYGEDVDLSYRAHLNGFKIQFIPSAIVKHDYDLIVPAEKIYHLEKGRYLILKKYMTAKDLILLLPSLIMAEALAFGYSLKFGPKGLKYKFKAIKDGLPAKVTKMNCNTFNRDNFFRSLDTKIPLDQLSYSKLDETFKIIANEFFELNWKLFLILNFNN